MAQNTHGGGGAAVAETPVEPFVGVEEFLHEEETHDWVEIGRHRLVSADSLIVALSLSICNVLPGSAGLVVPGIVPCMGWQKIFVQGDCVLHKLDDAGVFG